MEGEDAPAGGASLPDVPFRSGFVALVGRPNVGKSTLLNRILDQKVSIVSDKPQTTRTQIRGVATTDRSQIVFLDTPGVHRPRTALGARLNTTALSTLREVDLVCLLIEAHAPIGRGDRFIAEHVQAVDTPRFLVVNKVDRADPAAVAAQLTAAVEDLGAYEEYFPVSARTGDGVDDLRGAIEQRLPEGPQYYPEGMVTDQPEAFLAAEIVREQFLSVTREEVPHSIAVIVEDIEERPNGVLAIRAVVLVERESQKGIVIGKGGELIKQVGTRARRELEALLGARIFLETRVKVERDWQRREHALDRLGY